MHLCGIINQVLRVRVKSWTYHPSKIYSEKIRKLARKDLREKAIRNVS